MGRLVNRHRSVIAVSAGFCRGGFGLSMKKRVKGVGSMSRVLLSVVFVMGVLSVGSASAASISSDGCPNAGVRAVQHTTFLSGCRAYEMVSPVAKGSADVNPQNTVQTTRDGGQALFSSAIAFPGVVSSTNQGYFLGERSGDGWASDSIEPPQYNPAGGLVLYESCDVGRSHCDAADESCGVDSWCGAGACEHLSARQSNRCAEACRDEFGSGPALMITNFTSPGAKPFDGGTSDFSHVVFEAVGKLTDDAVDGVSNVYDYSQADGSAFGQRSA